MKFKNQGAHSGSETEKSDSELPLPFATVGKHEEKPLTTGMLFDDNPLCVDGNEKCVARSLKGGAKTEGKDVESEKTDNSKTISGKMISTFDIKHFLDNAVFGSLWKDNCTT